MFHAKTGLARGGHLMPVDAALRGHLPQAQTSGRVIRKSAITKQTVP